jgi:hypothetical protein
MILASWTCFQVWPISVTSGDLVLIGNMVPDSSAISSCCNLPPLFPAYLNFRKIIANNTIAATMVKTIFK